MAPTHLSTATSTFAGRPAALSPRQPRSWAPGSRAGSRGGCVRCERCLIANTKGGGHAFIGLHLAKRLLADGHQVTIMNDGDEGKLTGKAPFSEYAALKQAGAEIAWSDPTDPSTYPSGDFDVVYDNNGKTLDACKPLIDTFKGRCSHHVFVSSVGAYEANSVEPMHVEGDARKASAGHVEVEGYLKSQGVPYTIFHPLYIYGPYTAKDCEQWFIDRVVRDRTVPLPAPGIQLTSLTHVEDVASMLATVPGNANAVGQEYNVCSDRCITFEGIVGAVAEALGKEAKVVTYDPKALGLKKGEGFPFRTVHFFASSDKAKRELGWAPSHDFMKDVKDLCDAYVSSGRQSQDVDFSLDDKILTASA
ncbi:unnamed protein product [Ostreobium quekettii]|uniref:NAD-dependent epimerase/dehydratase domain-containing protein n=1 Tax=Ostreobium quekettii TaxID=121088 RepID=A0A8S1JGJ6_9CHLO|nr:unnamed protein product [Ostreobium quekettii]|eukprot:evm.model.scf_2611.1 EVM.evm.TU.scf_2611.1   scf_2611:123-5371(+)